MARPSFDLQSHSTHSDGTLAPAAVVAAAAAAGVELLALTDHDSVSGVDEALAAAREQGIRVVPAAELSTLDEAGEDLHLLGYGIDHHAAAFTEALAAYRADRRARGHR
ncbi:MAG: PHP domain-containing protein, partial [Actinomycetota bacterium]|nr:PHP domain-containing protein [Actinomycetota bacterium]